MSKKVSLSRKKQRKSWVHCEQDDITCPVCRYQLCDMESLKLTAGDEYNCPDCKTKNALVAEHYVTITTVQTVKAWTNEVRAADPEWHKLK